MIAINMPMPADCGHCRFLQSNFEVEPGFYGSEPYFCVAAEQTFASGDEAAARCRPEWCPLSEHAEEKTGAMNHSMSDMLTG